MSISLDQENGSNSLESPAFAIGSTVDERRNSPRTTGSLSIQLTTDNDTTAHTCQVSDICEGGVFVSAPADSGLCVGQRCEVTFADQVDGPQWASLQGEARFATVVRTSTLPDGSASRVGAGLRFDQRLYL